MGTIARQASAPIVDGETAVAADVENEFTTVFDVINGNLDDANLADSAVTTAKLAANAVTQAKMTSGAATASEMVYTDTGISLINGTGNIGASISHVVGNPARHVILLVSFNINFPASGLLNVAVTKDGGALPGYTGVHQLQNPSAATWLTDIYGLYVDTAPTAGATHVYQVRGGSLGSTPAITKFTFVAFEPRS